MKKFLIGLVAAAGIAGLVWAFTYQPKSDQTSSASPASTTEPVSTSTGSSKRAYKDGTYTGQAYSNRYGNVQVSAVISGGKITDVKLLQMPNSEMRSEEISAQSGPILVKEVISIQDSNVDIVSGATSTSESFTQSLQSALNQA